MPVYIFENGFGYIKVGKTLNIPKRIASHQTSNPRDLKIIATLDGYTELENDILNSLEPFRVDGKSREWFYYNEKTKKIIDEYTKIDKYTFYGAKPNKLLLRLLDDSESRISTSVVGAERIAKLDEHEESLVIDIITNPVPLFENVPEEWIFMALNHCGFQKADWEAELTSSCDSASLTNDAEDDFENPPAIEEDDLSIRSVLRRVVMEKKKNMTQHLIDFYNQDIVNSAIKERSIKGLIELKKFLEKNPHPHSWDIFGVDYKIWLSSLKTPKSSPKELFCFSDRLHFYKYSSDRMNLVKTTYSNCSDIFSVFNMDFRMGHGDPNVLSLQLLDFIKGFSFKKGVVLGKTNF